MKNPILPLNESERLKALKAIPLWILCLKRYDSITQLASYICGTPMP
jgi:hypothetical protein